MKLYCAGRLIHPISEPFILRSKVNRLWSYYDLQDKDDEAFDLDRENGTAFLDSGAFSALTRDRSISLERYIEYLHAVDPVVGYAAALDVIGDFDATQRNYERMTREDFRFPIYSTIHFPATREQVCRALDALKWPYLAIGGLVPIAGRGNTLRDFLDHVWRLIRERKENLHVHCFGITKVQILERYPFYSADSTVTLLSASKFGTLTQYHRGKKVACYAGRFQQRGRDAADESKRRPFSEIMGMDTGEPMYPYRVIANIREHQRYQWYLTELWRRRGVEWDT